MRKYLALIATLAVIAVNAAANIIPINGVNTGEVSGRYPTGFTPAGWVFAIWSLIYLGLMAFAIFAARVPADRAARARLGPWPPSSTSGTGLRNHPRRRASWWWPARR